MQASHRHRTKRVLQRVFLAAGVVALAGSALAPAAEAKHRDHRRVAHRQVRAHKYDVFVPRAIPAERRAFYGQFYTGRAYYAPHRHYHVRYSFPVYAGGAVAYRPYFYCGDHVFLSGAVALPRLAVGFRFGPAGGTYRDYGYDPYDGHVGCGRYGYDEDEFDYDDDYDDDDADYEYEDEDDD